MEEVTDEALKQIVDMKYRTELIERNIKDIVELTIVFKNSPLQ